MNLKKFLVDYWVASLAVILGVVLSIIDSWTSTDLLTNVAVITGFGSLIIIQLSLISNKLKGELSFIHRELESELDPVTEYINHQSITKPIWESEFYDEFELDVRKAERRVYITYFDNEDPRESNDDTQSTYYEQIDDVAEEKDDVQFRRMIRGLPQLDSWVDDLIETHEGNGNFSLSVILDNDPDVRLKSHIPVQLIDNDILYFVAVGEQYESGDPRDMFVQSEELNTQWERYYDRIWDEESLTLINKGRVRKENVKEYKQHIENLQYEE